MIVPLVCANCRIGFSFLSWLGDGVERGANVTALIVRQHPHKVPDCVAGFLPLHGTNARFVGIGGA